MVRPTSETVIGEMYAKWISSYRDLPILINQWANVVRWELRPRIFLRTTEFLWQEGHTAHADEADAMAETMRMFDVYAEFAQQRRRDPGRPGREDAGGAVRRRRPHVLDRGDDARRQGAAVGHVALPRHQLRQGVRHHLPGRDRTSSSCAHTTSWGMSTRMIGAVILAHGDDQGLVLPPRLAPIQVVIVPIGRGEQGEARRREGP